MTNFIAYILESIHVLNSYLLSPASLRDNIPIPTSIPNRYNLQTREAFRQKLSRYLFPESPIHCITISHQMRNTLPKTYQVRGKYSIIFLIASNILEIRPLVNLKLYKASPFKISLIILNPKYSKPSKELKADSCSQSCFRNPY